VCVHKCVCVCVCIVYLFLTALLYACLVHKTPASWRMLACARESDRHFELVVYEEAEDRMRSQSTRILA